MDNKANEDHALWGTVTLALPHLTEWSIEGTEFAIKGTDLGEFLEELNTQGKGKPVTLSINLLLSLRDG